MSKNTMWGIVVVAFLVGLFIGYYYEKTKMTNLMGTTVAGMQQQVNDANAQLAKEKAMMVTPTGEMMK